MRYADSQQMFRQCIAAWCVLQVRFNVLKVIPQGTAAKKGFTGF